MKKLLKLLMNAPVAIALAFLLVGAPAAPVAQMLPSSGEAAAFGGCEYTIWGCPPPGRTMLDCVLEPGSCGGPHNAECSPGEPCIYDTEDGAYDLIMDWENAPTFGSRQAAEMCELADVLDDVAKAGAAAAVVALMFGVSVIPPLAISAIASLIAEEIEEEYDC